MGIIMIRWGLNGRPIYDDEIKVTTKQIPVKTTVNSSKKRKKSYISIVNGDEIIDEHMEINVLGRLLDKNNRPISNVKIKVLDNHRFIRTLKTSSEGYFIFYGGYFNNRHHSFVFSFKGNKNYKSSSKSLVIT